MTARAVNIDEAIHERKMLKLAVPPRLENLRSAFRQLEHLAQYNPEQRDRDYILSCARYMLASLTEKYENVAATQLDMGLFNGEEE